MNESTIDPSLYHDYTMTKKIAFFIFLFCSSQLFANHSITDYQRIFLPTYTKDGHFMLALRIFNIDKVPTFLIVDPESLQTKILPVDQCIAQNNIPIMTTWSKVLQSRYYQILEKNTSAPYPLENKGVTHAAPNIKTGNILTIDLCPSRKKFEANLFNRLVELADKSEQPTPITIAISGLWIIQHPEEFKWLMTQEKANKLAITWANHSFSHVYYRDLPYNKNFLLSQGTHMNTEIMQTEKSLLEAGELPSVFFRFPGLVSDESLIKKLKRYGLIPLGTDAWLADLTSRGQKITPGGIILVHGNSNEPQGIAILLPLLNTLKLLDINSVIQ